MFSILNETFCVISINFHPKIQPVLPDFCKIISCLMLGFVSVLHCMGP